LVIDVARLFSEFTPGAYGIWSGVLMFAAWWLREWRETRKMSAADRLARRDGYARQVETLMKENRALGQDLAALRKEYGEYRTLCHTETDQLREMIVASEDEIQGLKRKVSEQSTQIARLKVPDRMRGRS
jgi:predicted  nucleic acid-binding Zn-ribbon protein